MLVLVLVLLLAAAACRDAESEVSGNSWECSCQFVAEAQLDNADVFACAMTAGEASGVAAGCLAASGAPPVWFCDCVASLITFCELGECRVW